VAKLNAAGSALVYSTYLGGSNYDGGYGIAVDSSGNAYVTGDTNSANFPTMNALQANSGGTSDAFVAKLNATGSALVYSTYLGGSSADYGFSVAVDSSGNAYVTGATQSKNFPTVNPIQAGNPGNSAAFVAKLNATGSALVYSTYLGGASSDQGSGIAVDSSGNAYVTGFTQSTSFPTVNAIQASLGASGATNAFVSKLNAAGSALVYSTYLGGSNSDGGYGIAVDSSGNAYVTGDTNSANFPTMNALQANSGGASDAFVAKLDATGSALLYSTYLGGSGSDGASGIAVDSSGDAYVTGGTGSSNFPTVSPFQPTNQGIANVFLSELNSTGSALIYSTYLGGSGSDGASGIAVDPSGNAYVTGSTQSINFPTVDPIQANISAGFVAKISPAASFLSTINVSFGEQAAGTTSSPYGEIVTNTGTANVTISSVAIGGSNASDFGKSADTCTGATVSPNGTCTVDLKFTPSATGNRNASLSFTDGAPGSPQTVSLNGTGIVPALTVVLTPPFNTHVGNVPIGTTGSTSVSVRYSGSVALSIISILLSGPDDADWTQTNNCLPSIAAHGSCGIGVTFNPSTTGFSFTQITITDYAADSPQSVDADGTGILLDPTISPTSLSFTGQLIRTTSASQPVTLTNPNPAEVSISSISISSGWTQTNNCLSGVLANGTCTINVSFDPTAAGYLTGTLTINDNAQISPQTVNLSGTGLAPVVSLSPPSLSFSGQAISSTSAALPITLTNTGTGTLTPLTIATSGDFAQTNNCPASLAVGGNCTINVTFTPSAIGSRTGSLTLTDNATNSPQTVSLSGTGLGATATLSPSTVTFSTGQLLGTTSGSQSVTLQNNGNEALAVTSISLAGADGGDFAQTNNCASSVAAGASCTINVTFTPTARGARTATVSLADSAAGSPQSIALSGTGIGPVASLSPGSLTFPGQFVGTTGLPINVTLSNTGDGSMTISNVAASTQFGTTNGCTSSLAAGVNCTISVFFDPSTGGSQTGTLTVTDNAPGSPQTVSLAGPGMDFAMSSTTSTTSVSPGQTANYSVMVSPLGGLNQTVSLTCSGAPTLSTCSVPPSVVLNGSTPSAVTVSVTTTAGSMAPPTGKTFPPGIKGFGRTLWVWALLMLASLAALAGARKRVYLSGLCLMIMLLLSACGGGGAGSAVVQTPGTPAGTYTLSVSATVTSTSTTAQLNHSLPLTLTVN
jgi:hypothetical protein